MTDREMTDEERADWRAIEQAERRLYEPEDPADVDADAERIRRANEHDPLHLGVAARLLVEEMRR